MGMENYQIQTRRIRAIVLGVVSLIILAVVLSFSVQVIEVGHMGVRLHWGAIPLDENYHPTEPPVPPGLYFVVPFQDTIMPVNTQVQAYAVKSSAGSNDIQQVTTELTLNYHLDEKDVVRIISEIGINYEVKVIQPALLETMKQVTALYTAQDLIKLRPEVKDKIENILRERLAFSNIDVDAVSMTDFAFDPVFQQTVHEKVTAQEAALREQNKIAIQQAIAQQKIADAEGAKQSAIKQAEGEAQSTLIKAQAEAEKIRLINEFLAQNPEYIEWVRVNVWNGHLPDTLILSQDGAGTFLQIPAKTIKSEEKP